MDDLRIQFERDYEAFKKYVHDTLLPEMNKLRKPINVELVVGCIIIISLLGWVLYSFFGKEALLEYLGLPLLFIIIWLIYNPSGMGMGITDFSWQKISEYLGFQLVKEKAEIPIGMQLAWQEGFCSFSKEQYYYLKGKSNGVNIQIIRFRSCWERESKHCSNQEAGFLVMMEMEKTYPGTTILVSDSLSAKWKGSQAGLSRVKLEWLSFEEKFDLFSNQERMVRKIFTPDVMSSIYDFTEKFSSVSDSFFVFSEGKICFGCEDLADSLSITEGNATVMWEALFIRLWFLSHLPAFFQYKLVEQENLYINN